MSGEHPLPEFRCGELLAALVSHRARFVVLGGVACWLHGARRMTADLDICPAGELENAERLSAALDELGAVLALRPELGDVEVRPSPRLLHELPTTRWRTRAGHLDVLRIAGAGYGGAPTEFTELSRRATVVRVRDATLQIAGLEDLVRAKQAMGRPQDLAALGELRARLAANEAERRRARIVAVDAAPAGRPTAGAPVVGLAEWRRARAARARPAAPKL